MGFKTKVQLIKRQNSEQWYINFPSALAQALEFSRSENVEWVVSDKKYLILTRPEAPRDPIKIKKNSTPSSKRS
jgi:antitoxin component of MazEF toxin-antitoxin module